MGLLDILNSIQTRGVSNDPRAQPAPASQGMSPMAKALLALLAVYAARNLRRSDASTIQPARPPRPAGGGTSAGPLTGAGGPPGGDLADLLRGTLSGAAAGTLLKGGLGGLLKQLQESGQGDVAHSWVLTGPNKQISQHDLANALGSDTLGELSEQIGMDRGDLLSGLSRYLPPFVDQLTPEGRLPTEDEAKFMIEPKVPLRPSAFTPSEALVQLFHNGLMAHYEILRASHQQVGEVPSKDWARAVLPGRILEVIASRAKRMQKGSVDKTPLVERRIFDYGFVLELSEHVPFRIDEGESFFSQLHDDLVTHLYLDGAISGRWGRLVLEGERINYELNGPQPREPTERRRPRGEFPGKAAMRS
jgi:uncharacterized protein YidB (DUF937 family)